MSDLVLSAHKIVKRYKRTLAVNDATFDIEKGKIYGFIGQNGAGKTTFIRLIAGMARPTSGTLNLFGRSDEAGLRKGRKKLGYIIESPSFYTNMSAEENIKMVQILHGIKDEEQVKRLLDMVGLSDTGKKKAKDFSLGMRQRLSIAMSLVNSPEFLVLDEPINGLDPVGIKDVRELLLRLNSEYGITILISSHILSELYQLVSDYIIIHKGRIVERLTQNELERKCNRYIRVKVDNVDRALEVLKGLGAVDVVVDENVLSIYDNLETETLAKAFMDERILVTELLTAGESLESYYVKLIGGGSDE